MTINMHIVLLGIVLPWLRQLFQSIHIKYLSVIQSFFVTTETIILWPNDSETTLEDNFQSYVTHT